MAWFLCLVLNLGHDLQVSTKKNKKDAINHMNATVPQESHGG
jgi:hypothetical protein